MNVLSEKYSAYFNASHVGIVTMHGKQEVISPILKTALGADSSVLKGLDTNQFGTFTRTIERSMNPIETLENKCDLGLQYADIVIASEGSFGAHPFIPYASANEELVMLKDKKLQLKIIGKHLTTETNMVSGYIDSEDELNTFLEDAKFPNHGVILRKSHHAKEIIYTDFDNKKEVLNMFNSLRSSNERVFAEVDLRAHRNPTRMKAIQKATENLIDNLILSCPKCQFPGFVVTKIQNGLKCKLCHSPTKSTLAHISTCGKCDHTITTKYPHEKKFEDPQFCDSCNP